MHCTITQVSRNAKTGPIMVTTTPRTTCPKVCALRGNGCYADTGPLRRIWDRLTQAAESGASSFRHGPVGEVTVHGIDGLLAAIKRNGAALWRHCQAGDLSANAAGAIDKAELLLIAAANAAAKGRGFCYTHHGVLGRTPMARANREAIEAANAAGFTVNVSANSPAHADKVLASGIKAPIVCIVPNEDVRYTPTGKAITICPAQRDEAVTCHNCGICASSKRGYIVGFIPHGHAPKKVAAIAGN